VLVIQSTFCLLLVHLRPPLGYRSHQGGDLPACAKPYSQSLTQLDM
jgi:hypothetical protein